MNFTNKTSQLLPFLFLFIVAIIGCQNNKATIAPPPNLFLFLADDLSYNDLGLTGNPYVKTKTIDAFAKQAISFERMYTPSAMCAPSRSALMTGLYPHRNGCHNNHGAIFKTVKSLPTYLNALGYQVALVGKRHIQPEENFPYDYVKFEEMATYLAKVKQPVCVIYASNEPHGPHPTIKGNLENIVLPAKWIGTKSTREKILGYYADIATLDREFEQFLTVIKANNLDKNALTIFTSDHGYEYYAKWSCYEAGLRIPFYLQANGMEFKTQKVESLTSFVDILPTFIELAGGTPPTDIDGKSLLPALNEPTQSVHTYIYGTHTTRGIYSGLAYPIRSVTDGKWKYIQNLNPEGTFQNIITNSWNFDPTPTTGSWAEWLEVLKNNGENAQWAAYYQKRPAEELYHLDNDPNELINLATDTTHHTIKEKLNQQLTNWMKAQNDDGMVAELAIPLKARDMSKVPK